MRPRPPTKRYTDSRGTARRATRTAAEAIEAIVATVEQLRGRADEESQVRQKVLAKRLVSDILDYCNRADFPDALIFTVAELIGGELERMSAGEEFGNTIPLKKIKQDDVEFEFAVEDVSAAEWQGGVSIERIKAQLNIYRRVRAC